MEKGIKFTYFKIDPLVKIKLEEKGLGYYSSLVLANKLNLTKENIVDKLKLIDNIVENNVKSFPFERFKDLNKCVDIFKDIIDNQKHIVIVSDFDCDGISSALMAYKSLKNIFKLDNVSTIVNRRIDGTGYNKHLISRILELNTCKKIDTIISFDHGSSDEIAFKEIKDKIGCNLIITDHHIPNKNNLPMSADVFINPHYDFTTNTELDISGCAIGFITLLYIYMKLNNKTFKESIRDFKLVLPHVGISTISDVMPLNNPYNRYLAKIGLNTMNNFQDDLWLDMKNYIGVNIKYRYKDIGYKIAPLINTGNRLSVEDLVFNTFKETDRDVRFNLVDRLLDFNKKRKSEVRTIVSSIVKTIDKEDTKDGLVIVVDTPLSLNGIIASNIGDKFSTPVICFNTYGSTDNISGSLRAIIPEVNMLEVMEYISKQDSDIINMFGGHSGAGGCNIKKSKLDDFIKLFKYKISEIKKELGLKDKAVVVDFFIKNNLLTYELYEELSLLEPYGKEWESPLIHSKIKINGFRETESSVNILFKTIDGRLINGSYKFKNDKKEILQKLVYGKILDVYFRLTTTSYSPYQLFLEIEYLGE